MSLDVGEKIKNLRIDKGLTQDELAERLNVSRALVCKWEIGSRLPAYSVLEELSTIFDVDSELLILADATVYEDLDTCIPANMDSRQASDLISDFVRALGEKDAELFKMRYIAFMDSKTIARKLGKSYGTVRNRLTVLRKNLRAFLERCV